MKKARALLDALETGHIGAALGALNKCPQSIAAAAVARHAVVTSRGHVIPLNAPEEDYCGKCLKGGVLGNVHRIQAQWGRPIKIVPLRLAWSAQKPFSSADDYVASLITLREAQNLTRRLHESVARRPCDLELPRVTTVVQSVSRRAKQEAKTAMTPLVPGSDAAHDLRTRLQRLADGGILAAHVAMLGSVSEWDVEQMRSVKGVVAVFPSWLTLTDQVRTAVRARRLLAFIRSRYEPWGDFNALLTAPVVQPATPPGSPEEFDQAQNIPAWQWALVSIAYHCACHVEMEAPREYRREIQLPEKFEGAFSVLARMRP